MNSSHRAEVGMRCVKYMVLTIAVLFILTSGLIISVGTTVYAVYHDLYYFIDAQYYSAASFLTAVGVIMLFVSLFGFLGALKESTCLVNVFALILSLVFILELSAAIVSYKLRFGVNNVVQGSVTYAVNHYTQDPEIQEAVDFIQDRLRCCGIRSHEDWANVTPTLTEGVTFGNVTVPESCCSAFAFGLQGEEQACRQINTGGCLPRMLYFVTQSTVLLATGAMTIAFLQIIGITFSIILAKYIRAAKSERELRRMEIRQQMLQHSQFLKPFDDNEKLPENSKPVLYVPTVGHTNA